MLVKVNPIRCMDCAGRAKRRRRFGFDARWSLVRESAIVRAVNPKRCRLPLARHLPPQSINSQRLLTPSPTRVGMGFTIMELLIVIAIIAAVTAISLPAIKGISQSHTVNSASQQLMDDLALARQYAMNNRSVVHVLFVPPAITSMTFPQGQDLPKRLMMGIYSTYAIYADRTVGDQPGQPRPRYLSKWKSLPEGVFIAPREFNVKKFKDWESQNADPVGRPFYVSSPDARKPLVFPFPTLTNAAVELQHISFSPRGSCVFLDSDNAFKPRDEMIELARGSILASRDPNTDAVNFDAR